MQLQPLNTYLSLILKGLNTAKVYLPTNKAKIGKELRKLIDSIEDVVERAKDIIRMIEMIDDDSEYLIKKIYISFYDQVRDLSTIDKTIKWSEIRSLLKIYAKPTYNSLRGAFETKMNVINMLIGYLYEEKIILPILKPIRAIDQVVIEEPLFDPSFESRKSLKEIVLTKDDYRSCRKELLKINISDAKSSIEELEKISDDLKKFVIENFDIADLF